MKKIIKYVIIIMVFAFTILFITLGYTANSQVEKETHLFTVKEYNGKIAIYEYDSQTPIEILDVYVESLPQSDRDKLENGINLDTNEQLNSLIEDYDG